jgi:hypothetical protein
MARRSKALKSPILGSTDQPVLPDFHRIPSLRAA